MARQLCVLALFFFSDHLAFTGEEICKVTKKLSTKEFVMNFKVMFFGLIIAHLVANPALAQKSEPQKKQTEDIVEIEPIGWYRLMAGSNQDELIDLLSAVGWQGSKLEPAIPEGMYDVFTRSSAPGMVSYLAVPKAGMDMGGALQFSPMADGYNVTPAAIWNRSADDIRDEIMRGMEAAIDSLCEMRAKPKTIRVKASAFGIVEVEATWDASEVCN